MADMHQFIALACFCLSCVGCSGLPEMLPTADVLPAQSVVVSHAGTVPFKLPIAEEGLTLDRVSQQAGTVEHAFLFSAVADTLVAQGIDGARTIYSQRITQNDAVSDSIVLFRERTVAIFPRAMLIFPPFAQRLTQSGDHISFLNWENVSLWLELNPSPPLNINSNFLLSGNLSPFQGLTSTVDVQALGNPVGTLESFSTAPKLQGLMALPLGDAVVVLQREINGVIVRLCIPLADPKQPAGVIWGPSYGSNVQIQEDDIILITTLTSALDLMLPGGTHGDPVKKHAHGHKKIVASERQRWPHWQVNRPHVDHIANK